METKKLTHGGDWVGFQAEYGFEAVDLSANVSPFGVPTSVREAVVAAVDKADRYPDPLCRRLRYAIAALGDDVYAEKVRAHTEKERPFLRAALTELGCDVVPGEANYLLFRSIPNLDKKLRPEGVLIRSCANYEGPDNTRFRTAIRTRKESDALLNAIKKVLN